MKTTKMYWVMVLAGMVAAGGWAARATDEAARKWTGVWDISDPAKPGAVVTLADDSGRLEGTIVFHVMNTKTGQRIDVVPRSLVDPHVEGDAVAFQVRRILKPHLKGEAPDAHDGDMDMVEMKMVPAGDGKATLVCAKCGESAPAMMTKER